MRTMCCTFKLDKIQKEISFENVAMQTTMQIIWTTFLWKNASVISCNVWLLFSGWLIQNFVLIAPTTTKFVCFCRLLKSLESFYGKQCRPRSGCSYKSSLSLIHLFASIRLFVSMLGHDLNKRQIRCFFTWRFRVKLFSSDSAYRC